MLLDFKNCGKGLNPCHKVQKASSASHRISSFLEDSSLLVGMGCKLVVDSTLLVLDNRLVCIGEEEDMGKARNYRGCHSNLLAFQLPS